MTDPITVDVPVKPTAAAKPAAPAFPSAPPTSSKPATAPAPAPTAALTPPPAKPADPPVPAAPVPAPGASLLGRLTGFALRNKASIGASVVFTAVVVVAAVQLLSPGDNPTPAPTQPVNHSLATEPKAPAGPAAPAAPPKLTVENIPSPDLNIPALPSGPIAPAPGAPSVAPTVVLEPPAPAVTPPAPVEPAAFAVPRARSMSPLVWQPLTEPPASYLALPTIPSLPVFGVAGAGGDTFVAAGGVIPKDNRPVVPTGGIELPKLPAGPAPIAEIPKPPVAGGGPAIPGLPTPPGSPMIPQPGPMTPAMPAPMLDIVPKSPPAPDVVPKTTPMDPPSPLPKLPAAPVTGSPIIPDITPKPPDPKLVDPKLPDPKLLDPMPAVKLPDPTPPPKMEFTKPANNTVVTPAVTPTGLTERAPTTTYDVDLYEPKAGDSYESICKEFYNDTRYAPALRAYNRNRPLQGAGALDVPPIHIVKRFLQPQPGMGTPTGRGPTTPEWGPSATAVNTGSGGKVYRVPMGGMSLRAIARLTLGNEQRWAEIYDLNPQITKPDAILPAGTEVRLPPDARNP